MASFLADFALSCEGNALSDAALVASMQVNGRTVYSRLPVATTADGRYQVSWTELAEDAEFGDYELAFHGAGDAAQGAEMFRITLRHQSDSVLAGLAVRFEHILFWSLAVAAANAAIDARRCARTTTRTTWRS